jgi:hypothetical protein
MCRDHSKVQLYPLNRTAENPRGNDCFRQIPLTEEDVMNIHKIENPEDDFANWMNAREWIATRGEKAFPTLNSWQWFYRTYKGKLAEDGVVANFRGRVFVRVDKIAGAVEKIAISNATAL